ncbi:MAG: YtxH domain-containing protein [Terriglobales bacterium]
MAEDNGNSFLWFLAGLGVGAVIGVLYAPKSGREMRDEIAHRADEGRAYVTDRARQAREQAERWVERGRDFYDAQKEQFKSAFQAGKEAYKEATGQEPGPAGSQG